MARIFEDVRLTWQGREYVVPANDVLRAIAKVEDVITLSELHRHAQNNTMPISKLAMAFGTVLRHAGARVGDDDVYAAMFEGAKMQGRVVEAIRVLLHMMLPPAHLQKVPITDEEAEAGLGKSSTTGSAARSSKKHSRSR